MKHDYNDNIATSGSIRCCIWTATNELRWLVEEGVQQLQQRWRSDAGEEKWKEVPIVHEENGNE